MPVPPPVHGSAPDIAGQHRANPLAAIGSVAMLFRYSLQRDDIASEIEASIRRVIREGFRTGDIALPGEKVVGCREMSKRVLEGIGSRQL